VTVARNISVCDYCRKVVISDQITYDQELRVGYCEDENCKEQHKLESNGGARVKGNENGKARKPDEKTKS